MARQPADNDAVEGDAENGHADCGEQHRAGQTQSQGVIAGARQQRAEHDPFADREIDHAGGFVDEHERQRDQRIDRAGQGAVDQQGQKIGQSGFDQSVGLKRLLDLADVARCGQHQHQQDARLLW